MSCQDLSRKHTTWFPSIVRLGVAAVAACFISAPVLSLPVNPTVVNGAASFNQAGNVLTVTNSNGAIINWQKFSIGAGETTHFAQTSASSTVLNRVLADPTAIYGTLSSNGRVWLVNPAGIMVGPGGRVDVAGFVASTLNIRNEDFLAGRSVFINDGSAKNVINQGEIRTPAGGSVYLIGSNVSNEGLITTPKGETILAAGATVSLIDSATPGVKVEITGSEGNATNLGTITAEAGRIGIAGVIVRNSGQINASSVVREGGRIFLRATQKIELAETSKVGADGTSGGNVTAVTAENGVVSGELVARGEISAQGDGSPGSGGFVETSAARVRVGDDFRARTRGGVWLIDPNDYRIAASGGDITGAALSANLASGSVTILSNNGGSSGNGDIFVDDTVSWTANLLTLSAIRDIRINSMLDGSGAASLALAYGQGAVAAGNTAKYVVNAPVNLPAGNSFSTRLGSDGTMINYTVIVDLGLEGSTSSIDLQGISGNLSGRYALGRNIDAAATGTWGGGAGFMPISYFVGILEGNGHTIGGLNINRPATDFVGMFAEIGDSGIVRNVGLVNANVFGKNYVGGLAGEVYGTGRIENSSVTGAVGGSGVFIGGMAGINFRGSIDGSHSAGTVSASGTDPGTDCYGRTCVYAGGLVGETYGEGGDGVISNSYSTAVVNGAGDIVGGLVGYIFGGIVRDSHATGAVTGSGNAVGGLAGQTDAQGSIANSWSSGAVSGVNDVGGLAGSNRYGSIVNSWSTSAVLGSSTVGGLVGVNRTPGAGVGGSISDSYASGTVSGVNYIGGLAGFNGGGISASYATGAVSGSAFVGGLVGYGSGTISDSYATGAVDSSSSYAGGLTGYAGAGTIANSYSTGVVTGVVDYGGLVGKNTGATVTNSFWDTETSGQLSSAGGIGRTTAQMQTAATFIDAGWSAAVWTLADGAYPALGASTPPEPLPTPSPLAIDPCTVSPDLCMPPSPIANPIAAFELPPLPDSNPPPAQPADTAGGSGESFGGQEGITGAADDGTDRKSGEAAGRKKDPGLGRERIGQCI